MREARCRLYDSGPARAVARVRGVIGSLLPRLAGAVNFRRDLGGHLSLGRPSGTPGRPSRHGRGRRRGAGTPSAAVIPITDRSISAQEQVHDGLSKAAVTSPFAFRPKCVTSWPTTLDPSGAKTRMLRVNVMFEFFSLRLKLPQAVA